MPSQMICWSFLLQLLFLLLLLLAARPAWPLHWGQPRPNWPPFPGAEAQPSNNNQPAGPGPQIPLQQSGPSQPHESYNEYLSKLAEYYNDFYTEYGSRYNDYLAKFSEWLKASFGAAGGSGNNSPTAAGNANALPPPPEWILPPSNSSSAGQPTAAARTPFHSHRQLCPSRNFPPKAQFNKNTSSNQTDTKAEPKFTHPLVLPILHGNFTVKQNAGANTNLSSIDPQQQHLAMHSAVTLVVDHDGEGYKRVLVVDTGLAALKHGLLRGLLANGVQPQQVDTVCITHPDTDTMGNLNLFPCAEVHSGNAISRENLFARQTPPVFDASRSELPFRHLFAHTELFLTPGMSFQDQTLLVRGVPSHGTVAIVGKLILNEQDLFNNLAIREFAIEDSEHRKLWQATRREIVCMADYIVPGYGVPFKVNEEVRRLAECGMPRKAKNAIWPEKKLARQ